jgi:hypothetical protein
MPYCRCGHVEGTHWAGEDPGSEYTCHAYKSDFVHPCSCTKFRDQRTSRLGWLFAR